MGRRTELGPAFVRLLQDNEAEVRVAAASKVSAFCKIFNNEAVITALLPCIKELSTDSSQCALAATTFYWPHKQPYNKQHLASQLSCRLSSGCLCFEPTHGCVLVTQLKLAADYPPTQHQRLLPWSRYVRSALASVVMELAPVLGKAATIEHLLPVFLALLKDDWPEVRLNIISKLEQVRPAMPPVCLLSLLARLHHAFWVHL